ncbi:MAG: O-antigen ligase family protein [Herminiimonas sp.]|nr:O-antigen ligase family protein [Herminiimonas sp.]
MSLASADGASGAMPLLLQPPQSVQPPRSPDAPPPLRVSSRRRSRYGSVPLLVWLFIQGLPLGRALEPAKPALIEEVYARSIELTAQSNSLSSALQVVLLGGLYLCSAVVVIRRPHLSLRLLLRHWPLLLLLALVGASVAWTYNPEKVVMNLLHNCGAVLIALAAALRYQTDPWRMPAEASWALGMSLLPQLGAVVLLPAYAIDWEGRWTGLTGQANTLGALAFCAFWAGAAAAIARPAGNRIARVGPFTVMLLATLAMAGADSVTSMLSSACVLAVMLRLKRGGGRLLSLGALLVVPVLTMLVVTLASVVNLSSVLGVAGRSGDFSGRTTIWADGIDLIRRQPWTGWSFDDHAHVIRTVGMQYTTFHNGYLDLGVAGGLPSILLVLALLATAFLQLNRSTRIARELRVCALPFMLAVLVYNTTEATLVSPRNPIWLLLLTLALLGAGRRLPGTAHAVFFTLVPTRYRR